MAFDRFLIAPINTGLQKDLPQWLLTEDAYYRLENAYIWRGRIRKRFGSKYMTNGGGTQNFTEQFNTRLRVQVGTWPNANLFTATVPGSVGAVGQSFTVQANPTNDMFTVYLPGNNLMYSTNTTVGVTGGFNAPAGIVALNYTPGTRPATGTPVYWYPALPVMGFENYEFGQINNQPLYAWDTKFVYLFSGIPGSWNIAVDSPTWHGSDTEFFWTTNYTTLIPQTGTATIVSVVMFASNFNATVGVNPPLTDDPIYFFNPNLSPQWRPYYAAFLPNGTTAPYIPASPFLPFNPQPVIPFVQTALIIIPWKNRLLLLNTIENDGVAPYTASINTNYAQRCRYSAIASPFTVNAWYEPNTSDSAGNPAIGGGYIDAATEEQIQGCEFIKDQLVVYFERSTWVIRYTQNQELPFVWERINSELGSEATFSTVGFDKQILAIGNTGVHGCNGQNTIRIDQKIPDDTFEIADPTPSDNSINRVHGIRDYLPELVYWTIPTDDNLWVYPNKVLLYNYRNDSWAYNDDSITAFGFYEQEAGLTWATATQTWASANFAWNSGDTQAQSRQVVAGNQEGFTFLIDSELSTNAPVISITNMQLNTPTVGYITITAINHNFVNGDWIGIYTEQGVVLTNFNYEVLALNLLKDSFVIQDLQATGTYTGGGTIKRVSQIDIWTKQLNPYNSAGASAGRNVFLAQVDFAVESTDFGRLTIDYWPSAAEGLSMVQDGLGTGALLGTNVLETSPYPTVTLEASQELLWHRIYFQADGTSIQMRMYLAADQLADPNITDSPLEIQAQIWYTTATSYKIG